MKGKDELRKIKQMVKLIPCYCCNCRKPIGLKEENMPCVLVCKRCMRKMRKIKIEGD